MTNLCHVLTNKWKFESGQTHVQLQPKMPPIDSTARAHVLNCNSSVWQLGCVAPGVLSSQPFHFYPLHLDSSPLTQASDSSSTAAHQHTQSVSTYLSAWSRTLRIKCSEYLRQANTSENIFNFPYISVNTTYKFEFTATCFDLTSHLQAYLWTLTSYNLPVCIWDPRWLTVCVRIQRDSYVLLYLGVYWGWHTSPPVHT